MGRQWTLANGHSSIEAIADNQPMDKTLLLGAIAPKKREPTVDVSLHWPTGNEPLTSPTIRGSETHHYE